MIDEGMGPCGRVAYSCGGSLGISLFSSETAPNSLFNPFKEPSAAMLGGHPSAVNRKRGTRREHAQRPRAQRLELP
jgi:hypothetical protein